MITEVYCHCGYVQISSGTLVHLRGPGRQGGRLVRWCVAAGELDETQVAGAEEGLTSRPRDGERTGTRMCVEKLGTCSRGNGHLIIERVQCGWP